MSALLFFPERHSIRARCGWDGRLNQPVTEGDTPAL
jgi:hypothetical protein